MLEVTTVVSAPCALGMRSVDLPTTPGAPSRPRVHCRHLYVCLGQLSGGGFGSLIDCRRNRDCRGSAASDWAEAQSGLPDWGVRGAWDLGAHNPTPDLELWSRRGMIKQPFGGVVRDITIAPEGDGRGIAPSVDVATYPCDICPGYTNKLKCHVVSRHLPEINEDISSLPPMSRPF